MRARVRVPARRHFRAPPSAAQVVLPPSKNPFKAATIVHQPANELRHNNKRASHNNKKGRGKGHSNSGHSNSGHDNNVEWSCSSCYVYAVHGREAGAPPLPAKPGEAGAGELGAKLRKLAERLRETEAPSPMP